MTDCPCCQAARETDLLATLYNSRQCKYCAARLIKRISQLPIAKSEATARMRAVLTDAVTYGHSETEIRALVKSGPWLVEQTNKRKR